jgi:hypothetical protein
MINGNGGKRWHFCFSDDCYTIRAQRGDEMFGKKIWEEWEN